MPLATLPAVDVHLKLKICIVEDNDDLRESLVEVLQHQGHEVRGAGSAEELPETGHLEPFELMLLDLNLPGEDGLQVAQRLKRVQPGLRIIMMTTRTSLIDRVKGYDTGADLYLPKPVAEAELLSAVRALARQIRGHTQQSQNGHPAALTLDPQAQLLSGPQGVVPLNPVEVTLLTSLAFAPGQRLEHWQLIESMGLEVCTSSKANLAVRITRLRGKLGQAGCPGSALKSLRTSGYQLGAHIEIR